MNLLNTLVDEITLPEILIQHYKQLLIDYNLYAKTSSTLQIKHLNKVIEELESVGGRTNTNVQAAHTLTSHRHAFNLSMREKLKVPLSPLFILLERFNLDLAWHGQPENSKSVYYQNNYSQAALASPSKEALITTKSVEVGIFVLAPYTDFPLHSHQSTEINIVLSGNALWYEEGGMYNNNNNNNNDEKFHQNYPPNSLIFHTGSQRNAIRTLNDPVLVLYSRSGNDAAANIKWEVGPTTPCLCRIQTSPLTVEWKHSMTCNNCTYMFRTCWQELKKKTVNKPAILNCTTANFLLDKEVTSNGGVTASSSNNNNNNNNITNRAKANINTTTTTTITTTSTQNNNNTIINNNNRITITNNNNNNNNTVKKKRKKQVVENTTEPKKVAKIEEKAIPALLSLTSISSTTKKKMTKTYYRGAIEARLHGSDGEWKSFSSIVEASKMLGVNRGSISSVCKSRALNKHGVGQKRAGKYEFRYADSPIYDSNDLKPSSPKTSNIRELVDKPTKKITSKNKRAAFIVPNLSKNASNISTKEINEQELRNDALMNQWRQHSSTKQQEVLNQAVPIDNHMYNK